MTAILVMGGARSEMSLVPAVETFLVPIDVCYSLAGALRLAWHGFDGGTEVRRILADLRESCRRRAKPLTVARKTEALDG